MDDLAYDWPELKMLRIVAMIRQEDGIPVNTEDLELGYYISSAKITA